MKTLNTIEELRDLLNSENYYSKGNEFDSYSDLEKSAKEFFLSITSDSDDQEEYYKTFGLDVGDVYLNREKVEKYFVEEVNDTVEVQFYEAYIDSGVSNADYYHAFMLKY